ncbi:hypothetical protein OWP15_27425 [Bacillus paranthracis]|uniref:hypothetical protein n=1 Tax=Bacillus paranthracis TaxID=2026186 RepID=UPI002111F0A2|nr:hypothetical protein [Bacillus paranthracis]HDR7970076.1 hypothetical protein [Bacillus pacificus]HDR8323823.1 hypothetical protein [Bacillus cereus]MCQ6525302.1 hypothetical protein [Bacillus paranthracis]MDK7476380.1 hypothetical protein [Bacillus paranthracis]HDR8330520.1 hypothetical protein [Bacillus cereus]
MKIENIQSIASKIEDLKMANFSNEKIMEILSIKENPDDILKEYEKEKDYRTIEEAAEMIGNKLEGTWNYRKVYNLINCENPQMKSVKKSNRQGIKIHKDEVERFIDERKRTREDYKRLFENEHNLSLEYFGQVEELEKENKEKDKKIADLEAKIKELEAELKKKPAPKSRGTKKDEKETGKVE